MTHHRSTSVVSSRAQTRRWRFTSARQDALFASELFLKHTLRHLKSVNRTSQDRAISLGRPPFGGLLSYVAS